MENKGFKVVGTVRTQRGSTDIDGKLEEMVQEYPDLTEEEARTAWKKEAASDKLNMDWEILEVEPL